MKAITATYLMITACLFVGCATSDVDSRKKERYAAYSNLTPERKALVDDGQIKVGMSEDAVYIAWGKPDEVLQRENQSGRITTWIYHGVYLDEHRYWRRHTIRYGNKTTHTPYLAREYQPRSYVSAKVDFADTKVTNWETLPRPHY